MLSWDEFQEAFEDQWYSTHLTQQVHEVLDPLCSYLEPLPAMMHWDSYLHEGEIARLKEMYHQHFSLGSLIMHMQPYLVRWYGRVPLPIGDRARDYGGLPVSVTSRTGYREFFDELVKHALPTLAEFKSFRDLAFERKKAADHS